MAGDITPYTSLVTAEYNQQPDFMAVMGVLLQPIADMRQVTNSIPGLYDLDTAVGQQLDYVGQWIGPTRYIEEAISDVYFSFDIVGLGFDQGVWAPDSATTALTALPDDFYRLLLYAAIARNHWDGTVPNAEKYLNAFWNTLGYYEYVIDNQDMTVTFLLVGPPLNPLVAALYYGGYLDVVAAGVGVANHLWVDGSGGIPLVPIFGFDIETAFIAGFDVGYWDGAGGGVSNMMALLEGVGQFVGNLPAPVVPDGTFAIFALGNNGSVTNQFTYSGAVVAASTSLSAALYQGMATGNSIAGIFAFGRGGAGLTSKFTYSGATVAYGSAITSGFEGAAASNATLGIFTSGVAGVTNQYVYSGDIVTNAPNYIGNVYYGAAVGNATDGFFNLGNYLNTMKDYNYAAQTVSTTTSLLFASGGGGINAGAAAGNSTFGIFATGQSFTDTNKFTYSGATVSTATALTPLGTPNAMLATGNSAMGIFTKGSGTSDTAQYTYSGDVVASSTGLLATSLAGAAAGNGTTGVNI